MSFGLILNSLLTFRYESSTIPSYVDNKESILTDLEDQGWPIRKEDVDLLENEIEQANVFLQQSKDLRKASEEVSSSCYIGFKQTFRYH